ncbi:hypothetical protein PHMEG_00038866 [Phytophthora megakarya]|uniref:ABC transporter n=1 Tax=Phytophthora megakarya TaxID=4795 RepID=A0A225UG84_9STRA|nr:hypothetical protein PHMEG_00038866 [Phytophthora megakarya]
MNSLRVANLLRAARHLRVLQASKPMPQNVKLVSTHGWNRKSHVKRILKSHFARGTGCNANIKAAVAWNDTEGAFIIRVTDYGVCHNHAVSKATCQNHVSNCQVQDPIVLGMSSRSAANASDCACYSSSCVARYRFHYD